MHDGNDCLTLSSHNREAAMDRRNDTMLLVRDLLEHLGESCDHWREASGRAENYLARSMHNDLDQLRCLLSSLTATVGDLSEELAPVG